MLRAILENSQNLAHMSTVEKCDIQCGCQDSAWKNGPIAPQVALVLHFTEMYKIWQTDRTPSGLKLQTVLASRPF